MSTEARSQRPLGAVTWMMLIRSARSRIVGRRRKPGALVALAAEHPTLTDLGQPDEPPPLRHAANWSRLASMWAPRSPAAARRDRRGRIPRPCDHDLPF
jgi:hypothetical protein